MALGIGISGPRGGGGGAIPSLSIEVFSDAGLTIPITSADFGDTVYINITTSISSPTEYRFLIFESSIIGNYTLQAGATLAYTISSFNDLIIFAESEDGVSVAAALTPFELTINSDADANAYVAKHNSLSGITMAVPQKAAVQWVYQALKGYGTTFGSDLWTKLVTSNSEIYAFTPVSSVVASLPTMAIDWIDTATPCTIVGFTPSDVANDGVTGGNGKYLIMKTAPSDFGQNDAGADAFGRTTLSGFSANSAIGSNKGANGDTEGTLIFISNNTFIDKVNSVNTARVNTNGIGMHSVNRVLSTQSQFWFNGVLYPKTSTSTTPSTSKFYGFSTNANGTPWRNINGKLAMLSARCGFTNNEMNDWNEIWQYFAAHMND